MDKKTFILANTSPLPCLNIPLIKLYQADEVHDLWHKTQAKMEKINLSPPFWAFPWAGGEALALYILEHPEIVRRKKVLDFAAGSGLVGIAARKAGALSVLANDIDPFACEAILLNARLNDVPIDIENNNLMDHNNIQQKFGQYPWDVILAGDVFYDKIMSETVLGWFRQFDTAKTTILTGDPGRAYFPKQFFEKKTAFRISTSTAIEDSHSKNVTIWKFNDT